MISDPNQLSPLHHFYPYGKTHAAVLVAFALLVAFMVTVRRLGPIDSVHPRRRFVDYAFGWIGLILACCVQYVSLRPSSFDILTSLPIQVCDLVMFIAPLALLTRNRTLRAITYFWGLGVSSIAFIFPDLKFGFGDFQFWVFWTGHAVIVAAAIYDLTARGFRPSWRNFSTAALLGAGYVIVMFTIDAKFGLNYGYVGQTYHHQHSPADVLGPWPQRVPLMLAFAISIMLLLQLPWSIARWRYKRLHPPTQATPATHMAP